MINYKKNILLADDDYMLLYSMKFALRSKGHNVTIVTNGISALYKILSKRGYYDLLITDIKMPLCDGIQLLDEINQHKVAIPVIAISAYDDPCTIKNITSKGCENFISKPFSSSELIGCINKTLNNSPNNNSTCITEV